LPKEEKRLPFPEEKAATGGIHLVAQGEKDAKEKNPTTKKLS